jgi:Ser/Thr protein kinase RdoA (MazF antagonist)
LGWELDLIEALSRRGLHVPQPVPTAFGQREHDGVVVQRWVDGREPVSEDDWRLVADELTRLHETTGDFGQRPGCCTITDLRTQLRSVDADLTALPVDVRTMVLELFDGFGDAPVSVIHGDPGRSNIRIDGDGMVWLMDWDESRVDVTWHDLSNLGIVVLDSDTQRRAETMSHAWEAINAWTAEPDYAMKRLSQLRALLV